MDKYFVGLTLSDRELQVFASNMSVERTMKEFGYDLISGPFASKDEAERQKAEFEDYGLFR